jgi:hypothetical protein
LTAALEKIITMDNLRKQHDIVVDMCCLSKRNEESVDHILLYCEVACALHRFSFFPSRVIPRRVVDLFACWWSSAESAAV